MKGIDVELWIKYRPLPAESIEQRHTEFTQGMSRIAPPLGFSGLALPSTPDCGAELAVGYGVKSMTRGLKFIGIYKYRSEPRLYEDKASYDDHIRYGFKTSNKQLDYRAILHEDFPKVIEAYRGYRACVDFGFHGLHYISGGDNGFDSDGYAIQTNSVYNKLFADNAVDGRSHIYTLGPAMYWDAEVCRRALGFDADEVVRRLAGKVPKVQRLMDGVYTVFNDSPTLSYAEFVEMNERFKSLLGLV